MLNLKEEKLLKENNLMLRTLMRIKKTEFITMLEETDIQKIKSAIRIKGYLMSISDFIFTNNKDCYVLSLEEKKLLQSYSKVLEDRLKELQETDKNLDTSQDEMNINND